MTSTRFLYNTTHLRLQNITLSYNLSNKVLKKLNMKGCQFSFIMDNIAIWTTYDIIDRNSYRQMMRGYPWESVYSLGANVTF